jgi:site-specific DNA-methyltransferase (adenine-specific)
MQSYYYLSALDAVEYLESILDCMIDCIITDPPYESLEKHRKIGTTTRLKQSKASSNKWFDIFPNSRFEELLIQLFRILKKNSHFYLFCDRETMFAIVPIAEAVGFRFWKPIVWDKKHIGMGYHYRSRYEFILFFEKGKRKLNDLGISDIIECPRIHRGYPTEKPSAVSEVLIKQSTQAEEVILDPFMGAGSSGIAAIKLGRHFLGCDSNPEAFALSDERISSVGGILSEDYFKDYLGSVK